MEATLIFDYLELASVLLDTHLPTNDEQKAEQA